jgi:plasmid stabilization system protein ParE
LHGVVQFIALDSPTYAAATAGRILAAVERLRQHPRMGRIVPEYEDANLRELIVGNYRVVYKIRGTRVGIVAIVHGSRELLRRSPRRQWDLD